MLATIRFFARRILEYSSQKILGDNKDWLSSANDAIPATDGSWSRIPISFKSEPTRHLTDPNSRRLLEGLDAAGRHHLAERTIRLCQACQDCGGSPIDGNQRLRIHEWLP